MHYYTKIKLSPNSGVATLGAIGRQPLKFGVRVRHRKWHGDPRAFRDCVRWPRARSRKHAFSFAREALSEIQIVCQKTIQNTNNIWYVLGGLFAWSW